MKQLLNLCEQLISFTQAFDYIGKLQRFCVPGMYESSNLLSPITSRQLVVTL